MVAHALCCALALTSKADGEDRLCSQAALRGRGWPCASSTTISATTDVLVVLAARELALGAVAACRHLRVVVPFACSRYAREAACQTKGRLTLDCRGGLSLAWLTERNDAARNQQFG